jgi:hypothetical protein
MNCHRHFMNAVWTSATSIALVAMLVALNIQAAYTQPASIPPSHTFFHVSLDKTFPSPLSGRLLLFIASPAGGGRTLSF